MAHNCKECGSLENTDWSGEMGGVPTQEFLKENQVCFQCGFWYEKLLMVDDPRSVRVQGSHYFIRTTHSDAPRQFRGYGGVKVEIVFFDGRRCTTNDLWRQGVIPPRFKDRLPDNAEFVR